MNRPVPLSISNRPILNQDLFVYWECFWILNASRHYGYGVLQPISISELKAYIEMFGITDEIDLYVIFVQHLDGIFLEKMNKQEKKGNKK